MKQKMKTMKKIEIVLDVLIFFLGLIAFIYFSSCELALFSWIYLIVKYFCIVIFSNKR